MYHNKLNDDWSKTSFIMAMILNVNKDCKKNGVTPFDSFNPYRIESKVKVPRKVSKAESDTAFRMMKKLWVDRAPEKQFKKVATVEAVETLEPVKDGEAVKTRKVVIKRSGGKYTKTYNYKREK